MEIHQKNDFLCVVGFVSGYFLFTSILFFMINIKYTLSYPVVGSITLILTLIGRFLRDYLE